MTPTPIRHGGASTGTLTESRAVLADIIHHDAQSIHRASLVLLLLGTDPEERRDARAALRLIERGTIR